MLKTIRKKEGQNFQKQGGTNSQAVKKKCSHIGLRGKYGTGNHLESVFQATYLYLLKITEIQKMTKTVHADENYQMFVK